MTLIETDLLKLIREKASVTSSDICDYLHFINGEFTIRDGERIMFEWYDDEDDDDDDDCTFSSSWQFDMNNFKLVSCDDKSLIIKFGDTKFEFLIPMYRCYDG